MRPILLEIEGFNSFEKKQSIDFEKLTSLGLFGIFGNTGSGKTTVLDAIIYALYEKTPRDSDNIINTNSKKAMVRYIFEIKGGNGGIYEIQRSTTSAKTGGKKAKLTKIEGDNKIVLASDKKTEVDSKIQDIIGLGYNDFVKTVVLPQGEFSNFLKEKNKTRKEMLERLFALQKYGDDLDIKIKKYRQRYDELQKDYDKQLEGYKDIDENSILLLKEDIANVKKEIDILDKEVAEFDKLQNEYDILEKNRADFEKAKNTYNEIIKYDDIMQSMKIKVEKLSRLGIIRDTISTYEGLQENMPKLKSTIDNMKKDLQQLNAKKEEYINEKKKSDEDIAKIPQIQKYIEEMENAIEVRQNLENIKKRQNQEQSKIKSAKLSLNDVENEIAKNKNDIINLKSLIQEMESVIEQNSFKHSYKQDVRLADNLAQNIDSSMVEYDKLNKEKGKILENIQDIKIRIQTLEDNKADLILKIESIKQDSKDDIYNLKSYEINETSLLRLENEKNQFELNMQSLDRLNLKLKDNESTLKTLSESLSKNQSEKESLDKEIKNIQFQNIVHEIRKDLHDGDLCPICNGVYHHHTDDVAHISPYEDRYEKLEQLSADIAKISTEISVTDNENKNLNEQITQLQDSLKQADIDNVTQEIDKCRKYKEDYTHYTLEKKQKDDELSKLEQLLNSVNTDIQVCNSRLESLNENHKITDDKIENIQKKVDDQSQNLAILFEKLDITVSNLHMELEKIVESEKIVEENNIKLSKEKSNLEKLEKNGENLNQKFLDLSNVLNTSIIEEERQKSAYNLEMSKISDKSLLNNENLNSILNENKNKINLILEKSKSINSALDEIEKELLRKNDDLTKNMTIFDINEANLKSSIEKIEIFIKNNDFANMNELFTLNAEYDKLDDKKKKIQNYENQKNESMIQKNISEISYNAQIEKIKNLEKDKKYDLNVHNDMKSRLDEGKKKFGYLESKLENQISNFEKKKDLMKKSKENQKILDEVSQIFSLFKGKSFVQFLAKYQLNYVCKKASEILRNISAGRFHIEIDNDGDFLVLDLANGGIKRNPSTLSGGETFLVSLSLALALSSQIQLKGNAPLEFFFMDEGFGTLDSHTLDVALDCLKKIKNENLSIGIISHIDKIKEFVPIKLEISKDDILNSASTVKIITG